MLKQDRHEVGDHDDGKQRVAKFSSARQIGGPVTRVHVADRDEKTGAGKREQLPQEGCVRWNEDTAMDFRQRNGSDVSAPGLFACGQFRHEGSVLKICLRASTKVRAGLAESPFSISRSTVPPSPMDPFSVGVLYTISLTPRLQRGTWRCLLPQPGKLSGFSCPLTKPLKRFGLLRQH